MARDLDSDLCLRSFAFEVEVLRYFPCNWFHDGVFVRAHSRDVAGI